MASTDTIVGIVGALLLAGVMVSVFVYEYNNHPDEGVVTDPGVSARQAFHAGHPLLNATEDLDGDGVANFNDTDMDDDKVADVNQTSHLVIEKTFAGSVGPPAPPAQTSTSDQPLPLLTGVNNLTVVLVYTTPAPILPTVGPIPSITLHLKDASGAEKAATTPSQAVASGSTVTVTLQASSDGGLPAGAYTLQVVASAGPATDYTGTVAIDYGRAAPIPPEDFNAK